jgi:hypothetical protein
MSGWRHSGRRAGFKYPAIVKTIMANVNDEPLTKIERLRRVILVCGFFTRNLAYYRAAWRDDMARKELRGRESHFWRHANSNFFDVAVLEWCKLFGDRNDKHHWSNILSDPATFESNLLHHLGVDANAFGEYIEGIRRYRDKFVAHLDSKRIMDIPDFDVAKAAIDFYHRHLLDHEISSPADLQGLVTDLDRCYQDALAEGRRIYDANGI